MILVCGVGLVAAVPAGATAPGTNGRIAYSRFADASFSHANIVSANPDGTGVVKLTSTPPETYDFNPDWSPDGTKVAFERDHRTVAREIYTMNADGIGLQQITFDGVPRRRGSRLVTRRNAGSPCERFDIPAGRDGLYVFDADGSNPVQVTQSGARGENDEPQWSPDGRSSSSSDPPATRRGMPSSR